MKLWVTTAIVFYFSSTLSTTAVRAFARSPTSLRQPLSQHRQALSIRGGAEETVAEPVDMPLEETKPNMAAAVPMLTSTLAAFGKYYGSSLQTNPILTKSLTAGAIFTLSDYLAQRLESSSNKDGTKKSKTNWIRLLSGGLVGLCYFGPAAHYWYETIFRLLPGTSLVSTLQKAVLGQVLFGPSFTCIFFAVFLLQSGTFSLGNWARKIRQDLPGAWLAGASFWPLVDLVSFSLIPRQWIPLFVNMCSLVWTIYLSLVANRVKKSPE